MKRVIAVLILLLAAGAGYWLWQRRHSSPAEAMTLYGNVEIREAQLAFNNQQKVEQVLVEEGQRVKAGQLLARLETARLEADVRAGQAAAAAAEQNLQRLRNGTRPEEIEQAAAEMHVAEVKLDNAKRSLERVQKTAVSGATSAQELDNAETAVRTAGAQLEAAQAGLKLARIGPRQEDIAQAEAQLRQRQAELALAQARLGDAALYAPADGVIRARMLEAGEMASPSQPAFTLSLTDPKWVRAYVPETLLGRVRPGLEAQVFGDSFAGRAYAGWVGFISPEAEFTPKNVQSEELRTALMYEVRVYVPDAKDELRLGMPVTVKLGERVIESPGTRPSSGRGGE